MSGMEYTGTQINYYFVCHRKLWLFTRDIRFENENEYVQLGRLIDENSYKRNKKQIEIGKIKIDFIDNKGVIHEVKKSNRIEKGPYLSSEILYPHVEKHGGDGCQRANRLSKIEKNRTSGMGGE